MIRLLHLLLVVAMAWLFASGSGPVGAVAGDGVFDVCVCDSRGVALTHARIELDSRSAVTDM